MKSKQSVIENKIVRHEALTFDDILLLPNYTDIKRQDVDLTSVLHPRLILRLPIISSPMDTVTEADMAIALARAGGLGVIHRNMPIEKQAEMVVHVKQANREKPLLVAAAVGVGTDFEDRVKILLKAKTDCICVDSSHGHSHFVIEAVRYIGKTFPDTVIMAGNIATYDGAKALMKAGAHILRVGMGPGSICTTRIVTGMGVPQISALSAVVRATDGSDVTVVADGGIKQMGDIAKAIAFGANAVMMGSLFARFDESPGEKVEVNGKTYKTYRGMGSVSAMKKGGAERYGQSRNTDTKKLIAEGVEGLVEYEGSVNDYLDQIIGSLRSSFYYMGAKTMPEYFETTRAIKISNAGLIESHPHSIMLTDTGGNYNMKR